LESQQRPARFLAAQGTFVAGYLAGASTIGIRAVFVRSREPRVPAWRTDESSRPGHRGGVRVRGAAHGKFHAWARGAIYSDRQAIGAGAADYRTATRGVGGRTL